VADPWASDVLVMATAWQSVGRSRERARVAVGELPTEQLRTAFQPIVDHYQARFDTLSPLIAASVSDTDAEFE
jgi:Flp pilus assembly CpaF family ATPase